MHESISFVSQYLLKVHQSIPLMNHALPLNVRSICTFLFLFLSIFFFLNRPQSNFYTLNIINIYASNIVTIIRTIFFFSLELPWWLCFFIFIWSEFACMQLLNQVWLQLTTAINSVSPLRIHFALNEIFQELLYTNHRSSCYRNERKSQSKAPNWEYNFKENFNVKIVEEDIRSRSRNTSDLRVMKPC